MCRARVSRAIRGIWDKGVHHSEFNPSDAEPVHFLQIWILPDRRGLEPGYEQKRFPAEAKTDRLCVVASPDGRDGSLMIHQDACLYASILEPGMDATLRVEGGRHVWVQVVDGRVGVNGIELSGGDGAAISDAAEVRFEGIETAEFLVFDLG